MQYPILIHKDMNSAYGVIASKNPHLGLDSGGSAGISQEGG